MIFYTFLKYINNLSISCDEFTFSLHNKAKEFLIELDNEQINKNRNNSFFICNKNSISMKRQTFQSGNFIFTYSLLDSDENQLVTFVKFIKNNFPLKYHAILADKLITYDIHTLMSKLFGNKKITSRYTLSLKRYNRWLINNNLSHLQLKAKKFVDLSRIDFDITNYTGPNNLFFTLLQRIYNLKENIKAYNKIERRLKF